ncbi:MAG: FIST C-terminal domain-containing protein [Phycisphaerales bacterium]|nr:FIST C-terminal domain-containing protein [Phycisphaerales bacterium]
MGLSDHGECSSQPVIGWGLSGHQDPDLACQHVIEQVRSQIRSCAASFGFVFFSGDLQRHAGLVASRLCEALQTDGLIGCSSRAVIGGRSTLFERSGLAVLAGAMPGVLARAFAFGANDLPPDDNDIDAVLDERVRMEAHRATFVLADPSTLAVRRPIEAVARATPGGRLMGALTTSEKGHPVHLLAGAQTREGGLVGLSIGGPVRVDVVIAQGARPVGTPLVVTKAHRNLIRQLGGRPAIQVLREVAHTFKPRDRNLLGPGLFLGVAVDEYRDRFGRGDFAISRIVGGDEATGSIAIDSEIRAGRTVQVHLLDPESARSDMALLLDAQKLHDRPIGALLLSDAARGPALFGDEWSDAIAVARAFDRDQSGTDAAKIGYEIAQQAGPVPLAGCFASAEIGPGGGGVRAHGLAACLALFREG